MRDLVRADPWIVVWQYTETEVVSALHKQTRLQPPLAAPELETALAQLKKYVRRWEQVKTLDDDVLVEVRARAASLMARRTLASGDALQLAAATLRFDPPMKRDFVVIDGPLARVAAREGFNVIRLTPEKRRRGR